MRIPTFRLTMAAAILLIGTSLSGVANAQATAAPGLSPKTISALEQMIQGLSPETINMLVAQANKLQHAYAGGAAPSSLNRAELKQHKAELEGLRTQICSVVTAC